MHRASHVNGRISRRVFDYYIFFKNYFAFKEGHSASAAKFRTRGFCSRHCDRRRGKAEPCGGAARLAEVRLTPFVLPKPGDAMNFCP